MSGAGGLEAGYYLRVLRRDLEHGERVPYERRLDVQAGSLFPSPGRPAARPPARSCIMVM